MNRVLVSAGVAAACLVSLGASPPGGPPDRPALFKDSRQSLAIARAQGRKDVSVLLAARPGKTAAVVAQAVALGGDVRYRDDETGYLRVRVPVDRATELAELPSVQAATLDYDDRYPNRLRPGQSALPGADPAAPARTGRRG